jgi:hypothetical protein
VNPENKSIAAAGITKRNVTAKPSLLPRIYVVFSARTASENSTASSG